MNIQHIVNINMKLDARLSGTCFIVLSNRSSWNSSWTGSDIRTVVVYDQQRHTVSSHTHKLTSVPVCCPSDRVKCLQLLRHNRCCLWLDAEQRSVCLCVFTWFTLGSGFRVNEEIFHWLVFNSWFSSYFIHQFHSRDLWLTFVSVHFYKRREKTFIYM